MQAVTKGFEFVELYFEVLERVCNDANVIRVSVPWVRGRVSAYPRVRVASVTLCEPFE